MPLVTSPALPLGLDGRLHMPYTLPIRSPYGTSLVSSSALVVTLSYSLVFCSLYILLRTAYPTPTVSLR